MLTQQRLKELLDYDPDTGVFRWKIARQSRRIGTVAGGTSGNGYRQIMLYGKMYKVHRLAWLFVHGEFPTGDLDHVNRDRQDNRIANLRIASKSENQWNRSLDKDNTSGFMGVSWHKKDKKWRARIQAHKKNRHLGNFDTPEEAHEAYLAAKNELHNLGERNVRRTD